MIEGSNLLQQNQQSGSVLLLNAMLPSSQGACSSIPPSKEGEGGIELPPNAGNSNVANRSFFREKLTHVPVGPLAV
eukprot:1151481-Amphidinium_carterae.1